LDQRYVVFGLSESANVAIDAIKLEPIPKVKGVLFEIASLLLHSNTEALGVDTVELKHQGILRRTVLERLLSLHRNRAENRLDVAISREEGVDLRSSVIVRDQNVLRALRDVQYIVLVHDVALWDFALS
jgi:hypothetical protein